MLNQCNLIGRTGKECDVKYTASGKAVANVSLAVSEKYKDRDGNKQEKTEWVNLVAWGPLAEIMGKYVNKGDLIFVSGKIQTRSYDDRDGNKRYITEIVLSDMQMLGSQSGNDRTQSGNAQPRNETPQQMTERVFNEQDSIPF